MLTLVVEPGGPSVLPSSRNSTSYGSRYSADHDSMVMSNGSPRVLPLVNWMARGNAWMLRSSPIWARLAWTVNATARPTAVFDAYMTPGFIGSPGSQPASARAVARSERSGYSAASWKPGNGELRYWSLSVPAL